MKNKLCITLLTLAMLLPSLTCAYAEENEKQMIVSEETSQTSFEELARNWTLYFSKLDKNKNKTVMIVRNRTAIEYDKVVEIENFKSLLLLKRNIVSNRILTILVRADDVIEITEQKSTK